MIKEVALITVSCVLFVQMGLSDAITRILRVHFPPLSCPKCMTFWSVLVWSFLTRNGPVESVATSFIASYCALWLTLAYDAVAILYNYIYEQITKTNDTSSDAERPGNPADAHAGRYEVSSM